MSKGKSKRRVAAKVNTKRLRDIVHKVQQRDPKGAHFTVWITPQKRVEWWPGTCRWASRGPGTPADMQGDMQQFIAWLRGQ